MSSAPHRAPPALPPHAWRCTRGQGEEVGIGEYGCVRPSAWQLNYRCQVQAIAAKQYIKSEWPLPVPQAIAAAAATQASQTASTRPYRMAATRATYQRHTCCSMARWACVGARLQSAQRGAVGGGQGWSAVVLLSILLSILCMHALCTGFQAYEYMEAPFMHALCTQCAGCAALPR